MNLTHKNVRTLVLFAWSAFFFWLWVTGESARYLGPRTQWLVPFGALTLAAAAAGYAYSPTGHDSDRRLSKGEALGLGGLFVPLLLGLLLAHSQLGALAASQKLTARGIDPSALAQLASRNAHELSFAQVKLAEHNPKFAGESGIHPGREVRLVGFVSQAPKRRRSSFALARFYITCCVADSVPIGVRILPADPHPAPFKRDTWLAVSGELVRDRHRLELRGTSIERTPPPPQPYLSFSS